MKKRLNISKVFRSSIVSLEFFIFFFNRSKQKRKEVFKLSLLYFINFPLGERLCRSKKCDHPHKASEQYFPVVLFIILYNVFLTFESVDEILKCDHSNESY